MRKILLIVISALFVQGLAAQDEVLDVLHDELARNMAVLSKEAEPAYYMNYRVQDSYTYTIVTSFGNLALSMPRHSRIFNGMVRVGSRQMDNTREIKSGGYGYGGGVMAQQLPVENDPLALRNVIWEATDRQYKESVKQYENVKANVAVKVEAEDKSDDFSQQQAETYYEAPVDFADILPHIEKWEERLKKYSGVFSDNEDILQCSSNMSIELVRKYFVDTEGTSVAENSWAYRISVSASTTAEDGMNLPLYKSYFAYDLDELPSEGQILDDMKQMSAMLSALRVAPVVEAYSGPALMTANAAGVFFHEIFGHRVEGSRLKQETDAQTFKKKVGETVLPADFSIIFDPQIKEYEGMPLSGSYVFDDEGVRGRKVEVVSGGKLESFLMSRTPIEGFPVSNGHGRGMIYMNPVTRQSNLILESSAPKSESQLRAMLIEEAKKGGKEYAYLFDNVAGGFTTTGRYMPNAFNVTPLVVYKVYTDGRPDELVRGVDLVGTPLSMFSQIAACGSDPDVFNGYCGAESGSIPVSCVSSSLLINMVETQKKSKSQSQPPILERPQAE